MSRTVALDPAKYPGIRTGYTFKKWGAQRALEMLDWVSTAYGPEIVEALAGALQALVLGRATAEAAARTIGQVLKAHGSAGAWDAFLRAAGVDASGAGLFRAVGGNSVPVYPHEEAQRTAQVKLGADPDTYFADDPLEALMLLLAMLCETFRPFGLAWGSVAPLFASMLPTPAA